MTPREVPPPRELTAFQQAVLVGTLLGDGSIARHGHHHRLFVKHKAAHRALVEWKHSVFQDFTTMPLHEIRAAARRPGVPGGAVRDPNASDLLDLA